MNLVDSRGAVGGEEACGVVVTLRGRVRHAATRRPLPHPRECPKFDPDTRNEKLPTHRWVARHSAGRNGWSRLSPMGRRAADLPHRTLFAQTSPFNPVRSGSDVPCDPHGSAMLVRPNSAASSLLTFGTKRSRVQVPAARTRMLRTIDLLGPPAPTSRSRRGR